MKRREISLFLKNVPGEFGKLADLLKNESINIESITIQDASAYVQTIFNARGKSLKRIVSEADYQALKRETYAFALIRLLVDQTDLAIDVLGTNGFLFEITPVIAVHLPNKPGILADLTSEMGRNGINLNYIYGSAAKEGETCLIVINPEDIELAAGIFGENDEGV